MLDGWEISGLILVQLVRKSGHSVQHWIQERKAKEENGDENIEGDVPPIFTASLCLAATLWRSNSFEKLFLPDAAPQQLLNGTGAYVCKVTSVVKFVNFWVKPSDIFVITN